MIHLLNKIDKEDFEQYKKEYCNTLINQIKEQHKTKPYFNINEITNDFVYLAFCKRLAYPNIKVNTNSFGLSLYNFDEFTGLSICNLFTRQ